MMKKMLHVGSTLFVQYLYPNYEHKKDILKACIFDQSEPQSKVREKEFPTTVKRKAVQSPILGKIHLPIFPKLDP